VEGIFERAEEAASAVRARWAMTPRMALVLGSGLGPAAEALQVDEEIPYSELPYLATTTALGHRGLLLAGRLAELPVVVFQGRLHGYEGHSLAEATFPVRLAAALGVEALVLTNAAGGMNPLYRVGDLAVLDDHVNLQFGNPLIGVNDDRLGPRFPDLSRPYDAELSAAALAAAHAAGVPVHRGVYVAVKGPSYETRAELRWMRALGGDLVGMSTVPEAIVAAHAGLRSVGISVVTNRALPDLPAVAVGHDVVEQAGRAAGRVKILLEAVARRLVEAG
jgi:purine-nucleoside phosphorylase